MKATEGEYNPDLPQYSLVKYPLFTYVSGSQQSQHDPNAHPLSIYFINKQSWIYILSHSYWNDT